MPINKLSKKYEFREIESKWQSYWQKENVYKFDDSNETFVIDTPPPTISGVLHMGHIFSYTHTDFIARYQRMIGKNVFYPMGFDNNGLPTERLVEKTHGIKASLSHEFLDLCNRISTEKIADFKMLFNHIALSIDWSLEYSTNSKQTHQISQSSFVDLYQKGYIYHKIMPTIWDPVDKTAISQAEIEDRVLPSQMHYIKFELEEGSHCVIATTRPELIPACQSVMFNPEDPRYIKLQHSRAKLPMCTKSVPFIADHNVKIEKGTGLVMCCTFGDELDLKWVKRHSLPIEIIINQSGQLTNLEKTSLNKTLITELEGLYVKDARKKIVAKLIEDQYIEKQDSIEHTVKCAERSGAPLEIILTNQWYIKILEYKDELLSYAQLCNWLPAKMRIKIEQWIEGLNWDWCISRQRYLGVPIPAWHNTKTGEVVVAKIEDLPINPSQHWPEGYNKEDLVPDADVMDTWATSSLTPQISATGINSLYSIDKNRYTKVFPADLRPQAHEIIRTWAFYTIVKSCFHNKSIPWKNLMISGWCLADDRSKMSKSKGNIISPTSLLANYGADVVRYWASTAHLGSDTVFSENTMQIGKKLMNKIWSAACFVESFLVTDFSLKKISAPLDQWIISKLSLVLAQTQKEFEDFEYCNARHLIETFFLRDYCDYYLEIVKKRAYDNDESALNTLSVSFKIILKIFAPFFPYITDELNEALYNESSIHRKSHWPNLCFTSENGINLGDLAMQVIDKIREYKSGLKVSIKYELPLVHIKTSFDASMIESDLKSCCNIKKIIWHHDESLNKNVIINFETNAI